MWGNATTATAVALIAGALLSGCGGGTPSQAEPSSARLEHVREQQRARGWLEAKCSEPSDRHLRGCEDFREQQEGK
jgi:hypothetical protein